MVLSESAHCAMSVVVELSRHYQRHGITCKDISDAQNIPLNLVEEVVATLEQLAMITSCKVASGDTMLYLAKSPDLLMIEDIVRTFDKEPFCGTFVDEQTGKVLPQSLLTKIINRERKYINNYLSKRYRGMILKKLVEYSERDKKIATNDF